MKYGWKIAVAAVLPTVAGFVCLCAPGPLSVGVVISCAIAESYLLASMIVQLIES